MVFLKVGLRKHRSGTKCTAQILENQVKEIIQDAPFEATKANPEPVIREHREYLPSVFIKEELDIVYDLSKHRALWDYIPVGNQYAWSSLVGLVLDRYLKAKETKNRTDMTRAIHKLIELP